MTIILPFHISREVICVNQLRTKVGSGRGRGCKAYRISSQGIGG